MGKLITGDVRAEAGVARIELSPNQVRGLRPAPTFSLSEKEKRVFDILWDARCRLTAPRICELYHERYGEEILEENLRKSVLPGLRDLGVSSDGKRGYGITPRPE
jgi:hypothetical protein